jgi:hypothetical protein
MRVLQPIFPVCVSVAFYFFIILFFLFAHVVPVLYLYFCAYFLVQLHGFTTCDASFPVYLLVFIACIPQAYPFLLFNLPFNSCDLCSCMKISFSRRRHCFGIITTTHPCSPYASLSSSSMHGLVFFSINRILSSIGLQ